MVARTSLLSEQMQEKQGFPRHRSACQPPRFRGTLADRVASVQAYDAAPRPSPPVVKPRRFSVCRRPPEKSNRCPPLVQDRRMPRRAGGGDNLPGRGNKCRRWRTTGRLCPAPGPTPALASGVRWRPGVRGGGAPRWGSANWQTPPGSNATARFSPRLMRGGGSASSKKKWQTPPGRLRGSGRATACRRPLLFPATSRRRRRTASASLRTTPRRGRRHLSSSGGVFPTFPATCPESHTTLARNSANRRPRPASW